MPMLAIKLDDTVVLVTETIAAVAETALKEQNGL